MFSWSSSATNFKIMCNCIHELLNVFEDPAQCEHTIAVVRGDGTYLGPYTPVGTKD